MIKTLFGKSRRGQCIIVANITKEIRNIEFSQIFPPKMRASAIS